MDVERTARARWRGDLLSGEGTLRRDSGGTEEPVSWKGRTSERAGGTTSPEELIAAAHAGCFSMSLSNVLAEAGRVAEEIEVIATCRMGDASGAPRIGALELDVRAAVPGLDQPGLEAAAARAEAACPVSNALAAAVTVRLTATLT